MQNLLNLVGIGRGETFTICFNNLATSHAKYKRCNRTYDDALHNPSQESLVFSIHNTQTKFAQKHFRMATSNTPILGNLIHFIHTFCGAMAHVEICALFEYFQCSRATDAS